MFFRVGAATDIGRKRSQNQDNIGSFPELGLFIVADGMGGHRGGETASSMVVEIVPQIVRLSQTKNEWTPRDVVMTALSEANHAIFDRSQHDSHLQGMGTTATVLLFKGNHLTIGHVGDSRCYFFRAGSIWQITRDHSLVQEKLRAGMITRAEVKTDRMKNVITRSVGFEPDVNVETYEMDVQPGDQFLACSDGLSGLVEESQLVGILSKTGGDLLEKVKDLIAAANSNGGDDNISTVLVEISES
jgi:serine/threonine protein phosphatase PrpC